MDVRGGAVDEEALSLTRSEIVPSSDRRAGKADVTGVGAAAASVETEGAGAAGGMGATTGSVCACGGGGRPKAGATGMTGAGVGVVGAACAVVTVAGAMSDGTYSEGGLGVGTPGCRTLTSDLALIDATPWTSPVSRILVSTIHLIPSKSVLHFTTTLDSTSR